MSDVQLSLMSDVKLSLQPKCVAVFRLLTNFHFISEPPLFFKYDSFEFINDFWKIREYFI